MAEQVIELYGGAVKVKFDPEGHTYFVRDEDDFDPEWRLHPSVTTIIHSGVNKADVLVPWGINCALEVFNAMVKPGVSYDEVELRKIAAAMKQARYNKKETAADIGTISHEWLKGYLQYWIEHGKIKERPLPTNKPAASCVTGALGWIKQSGFQPTLSEKIIYSRRYKYIGTMDATSSKAVVYGRKAIVDWKSSKDVYPEMRFQLAAYLNAISEESDIDPTEYDRFLIKLGKEDGDFKEHKLPGEEYVMDRDAFIGMIPVYHRMHDLNKKWKARHD